MNSTLKDYMESQKKSEGKIFEELELSDNDKKILKSVTLDEHLSIPALVNLVLRLKDGQIIKEENKEELLLRNFITEKGNVTNEGKLYIESDETKQRLINLMNE